MRFLSKFDIPCSIFDIVFEPQLQLIAIERQPAVNEYTIKTAG